MHLLMKEEEILLKFRFPVQVYLLGIQCGLSDEPALCAVSVLHLQYVVSQVFPSHFHHAFLTLQIQYESYYRDISRSTVGLKANACCKANMHRQDLLDCRW